MQCERQYCTARSLTPAAHHTLTGNTIEVALGALDGGVSELSEVAGSVVRQLAHLVGAIGAGNVRTSLLQRSASEASKQFKAQVQEGSVCAGASLPLAA